MLDLDGAGRRLAAFHAGAPTPLPAIEARARRHRRRRRLVEAGGASALLVGVVLAGLQLVPPRTTQSVAVQGAPTTTAPVADTPVTHAPVAPPTVVAPRGWFLQEVGLLAFDTPNWSGGGNGSAYTMGPCPDRRHCVIVPDLVARRSVPTTGMVRTTIHGLTVWETTDGSARIYDVPSTGIELSLRGPDAREIARTIHPSVVADVLAAPYPLTIPAGWKTVTYDGVTVRVPSSWAVRPVKRSDPAYGRDGCSVPAGSTIYLGSFSADCPVDESSYPYANWLWLGRQIGRYTGPAGFVSSSSAAVPTGTPGVEITLPYARLGEPLTRPLTIRTATGTLSARLGIGDTSAVLEEEILASIRPARGV